MEGLLGLGVVVALLASLGLSSWLALSNRGGRNQSRRALGDDSRRQRAPYRMWGPKYWLTLIPWIGNLFALDYLRGRQEAIRQGEIKAWPRWTLVPAGLFAIAMIVWWIVDMWNRLRS